MAASIESPTQFERDLRSANQEFKRSKDSRSKWSNGARPLAGCHLDWNTMEAVGGSEHQRGMARPRVKNSETSHYKKTLHNISKFRSHWEFPQGRLHSTARAKEHIKDPLSRSVMNMAPSPDVLGGLSASEDWKYSFDQVESPGRPMTLDVFVKTTTGRETERMVEKEYEILNENGQVLKGRKARQNLRQEGGRVSEEDGFQLV
ncbi:hypothetical protein CORC01_01427 [Colletotrichum orchidophilum]|uniref:Uncharacterized protein n=1 Tax=Colletotrichum orchidophilum TaxID=1209926 RepID=A0A1G4BPM8_9PEZI|nr:uncharacterized protein CORC01_01427 [Colletotrichum orchidophilum]OHF03374.1 hypothetical protein CORC01_01427 [Colletotrichum orchidophilum]